GSIPGFKSASTPNWTTATVPFDTSQVPGTAPVSLVFWVVVWMENPQGGLVTEMPGHGLTKDPINLTFNQITDVPSEPYSNDVGMYGVHTQFAILPANPSPGASLLKGRLEDVSISTKREIPLDSRATLTVKLRAANAPVGPVTVAYYDGNPAKKGKLLDVQTI